MHCLNRRDNSKWLYKTQSERCFLLLDNDNINSQIAVFLALQDITKLDYNLCHTIMLTAHNHQSAVVMSAPIEELKRIQNGLRSCNLTTRVVQIRDSFSEN